MQRPISPLRVDNFARLPAHRGRLDYLDHQNAAVLACRHNKLIINLFIMPSSQKDRAATATSKRGYNIMVWRINHLAFELLSDLDAQELEDFAKLFMDRLQHKGRANSSQRAPCRVDFELLAADG